MRCSPASHRWPAGWTSTCSSDGGIVLHHGGQLDVVASHQEARRHRAHQQFLGGDHSDESLADARILGQAARVPPARSSANPGSVMLTGGFAFFIGDDLGVPVGSVGEILARHRDQHAVASAAKTRAGHR